MNRENVLLLKHSYLLCACGFGPLMHTNAMTVTIHIITTMAPLSSCAMYAFCMSTSTITVQATGKTNTQTG